ncbi:MAG: pirin family protein [Burkholderiaceae bacterium]
MLTRRPAQDRGHANHGWLDSYHSFSFADYFDPLHMGYGPLRVINEDRIEPGAGFDTHGHRDMEIITIVLAGELEHRDSLGNGSVIRRGEIQRMSAGTGIRHSEFNPSREQTTHLLQIWIEPDRASLAPGYEQVPVDLAQSRGRLVQLAGPAPVQTGVSIHQDARLMAGEIDGDESIEYPLPDDRRVYLHLAEGSLTVNGQTLSAGDALKIRGEPMVRMSEGRAATVLLFDLP